MDLKERDKYRDVLRKAAPDLRKYLAIDDGLLVEFAAVDVISLEEKEIIQNPQLIHHKKVDKLLEFIRSKIHIAFFPFMKLLKAKDEVLHKHVSTFISDGALTMPPDAPANQLQDVQQANTAWKSASPQPPQPRTTASQGRPTVQQLPRDNQQPLVHESSTQQQIVSINADQDHVTGNVDDNSGNSLPELVDQLDIKTEVNKPSPDSSCEKKAIVKKDAAPRWKQSGLFNIGKSSPNGLAINQHGDIVLASFNEGVKVYSRRSGKVKCTVYTSPGAYDVAVTHDNKYVTALMKLQCMIAFHDSRGKKLSTVPIKDVNNRPSDVHAVAIDTKGRIIVGQGHHTISIHNSDGSVISKFASQLKPYRLAITSNDEIVSSLYDKARTSVQLMDYSGGNIRVIQPPPDVNVWYPGYVCCRQGEIFVTNEGRGDPAGVYRYTSEGEYLGCVTTDVTIPQGIALSEDGNELFVADSKDNTVKIFMR